MPDIINPNDRYIPGTNYLRTDLPDLSGTEVPNNYEQGMDTREMFDKSLSDVMSYKYGYAPDPTASLDPGTRRSVAEDKLRKIEDEIRNSTRGSYYSDKQAYSGFDNTMRATANGDGGFIRTAGRPIAIRDAYTVSPMGNLIPKTRTYLSGINNEDMLGRFQTRWEKSVNGVGKLAAKTGINVLGNTVGMIYGLVQVWRDRKFSSLYDNEFTTWMNEMNALTDYYLPHYYTEEEKHANALNRIFSWNGIWNDAVGNGVSFVLGAVLSVMATGGLGIARLPAMLARAAMGARVGASAVGARIGASAVGRAAKGAWQMVSKRKTAALRQGTNSVKVGLSSLKRAAGVGRAAGDIARTGVNLFIGAGYEAAVEANSYLKDSEQRFSDYVEATTGKKPSLSDMAAFRKSNEAASNFIYVANIGLVGLSHLMLFGKYAGLGSTAFFKGSERLVNRAGKFIDNKLFGLGARRSTTTPGTFEVIKANRAQKFLRTSWNVLKRPLVEGVWEEGLQGVFQNSMREYIDSQYNEAGLKQNLDLWEAVKNGFAEQYSSDEGWTEIGIGALIGAVFGVRSGFGLLEAGQRARAYSTLVDSFNSNQAYSPDQIRQLAEGLLIVNQQGAAAERGKDLSEVSMGASDDLFAKFSFSDRMGMLDEHIKDINDSIDALDVDALAKELGLDAVDAKAFKQSMKDNVARKVEIFKDSWAMANNILGETARTNYGGYVANTIFSGMDSEDNIRVISSALAGFLNNTELDKGLPTAAKLKKATIEAARDLEGLDREIENLERQAEEAAASNTMTDEQKAAVAQRIQDITKDRETVVARRDELRRKLERSANMDANTLADALADAGVNATAEQVLAAYDALVSVDEYLRGLEGRELSTQEEAIKTLVAMYKENVANMRNAVNLSDALRNRRFTNSSYRRFKAIEDGARKRFLKIDTGDRTRRTSIIENDGKIDQMERNGDITSEEAFSLKFFNHLRDKIYDSEGAPLESAEETVDDETYSRYMDGPKLPVGPGSGLLEVIADTVESPERYGGLSVRERAIYDRYRAEVDSIIDSRRNGVRRALDRLTTLAGMITQRQRPRTMLDNVRDMLLEDASEEDKADLKRLEAEYRGLKESGGDTETAKAALNKLAQDLGFQWNYSDFVDNAIEEENAPDFEEVTVSGNGPGAEGDSLVVPGTDTEEDAGEDEGGTSEPTASQTPQLPQAPAPQQGTNTPTSPPAPTGTGGSPAASPAQGPNTGGTNNPPAPTQGTNNGGTNTPPATTQGTSNGGTNTPPAPTQGQDNGNTNNPPRPSNVTVVTTPPGTNPTDGGGAAAVPFPTGDSGTATGSGTTQPGTQGGNTTQGAGTARQNGVSPAPTNIPSKSQGTRTRTRKQGQGTQQPKSVNKLRGDTNFQSENPFAAMTKAKFNPNGDIEGYHLYVMDPIAFLKRLFGEGNVDIGNNGEVTVTVVTTRFLNGQELTRTITLDNPSFIPADLADAVRDRFVFPKFPGIQFVLVRNELGELTYLEPGTHYGREGDQHSIDQDAAIEVKEGDTVVLKIDPEDPYNKTLWNDPTRFDREARIEIWSEGKDGKLLGFVPAANNTSTPAIRKGLYNRLGLSSDTKAANIQELGTAKVSSTQIGAPRVNVDENGELRSVTLPEGKGPMPPRIVAYGTYRSREVRGKDDPAFEAAKSEGNVNFDKVDRTFIHEWSRHLGGEAPIVVFRGYDDRLYAYPAMTSTRQDGSTEWSTVLNTDALDGTMGARFNIQVESTEAQGEAQPETRSRGRRGTTQGQQETGGGTPEGTNIPEADEEHPVAWDKGLTPELGVRQTKDRIPRRMNGIAPVSFTDWLSRLVGFGHIDLEFGPPARGTHPSDADEAARSFRYAYVDYKAGGYGNISGIDFQQGKDKSGGYNFEGVARKKSEGRTTVAALYDMIMASEVPSVIEWRESFFKGLDSQTERYKALGFAVRNILDTIARRPNQSGRQFTYPRYALALWSFQNSGFMDNASESEKGRVRQIHENWNNNSKENFETNMESFKKNVDLSPETLARLGEHEKAVDRTAENIPDNASILEGIYARLENAEKETDPMTKLNLVGDILSVARKLGGKLSEKERGELEEKLKGINERVLKITNDAYESARENNSPAENGGAHEGTPGGNGESGNTEGQRQGNEARNGTDGTLPGNDGTRGQHIDPMAEARALNQNDPAPGAPPHETNTNVPEAVNASENMTNKVKNEVDKELKDPC